MTHSSAEDTRREARLNLRASKRQDALIREAAGVLGKSVTDFVLDSACTSAEQVLADRRYFEVDESTWRRFEEALDRPVRVKPRLARLFEEPGALDET